VDVTIASLDSPLQKRIDAKAHLPPKLGEGRDRTTWRSCKAALAGRSGSSPVVSLKCG